jgi:hypothetical protein
MDQGEVQILKGPGLNVTDRRIIYAGGELSVSAIQAPQIEITNVRASVTPTIAMLGLIFITLGLLGSFPPAWIFGIALTAFAPFAKVTRKGYALNVEADGARQTLYTTPAEADAKLALAAVTEALRRSGA